MILPVYDLFIDGKYFQSYGSIEHLRGFLTHFVSTTSFSKLEILKNGGFHNG